jgi:dUTP pyrophosphatase
MMNNMTQTIKFLKVRDVKSPVRGTAEAAGIDFFVPNCDAKFIEDLVQKNSSATLPVLVQVNDNQVYITIMPNSRVLIPSGVHSWMAPGTALIAANKSGVATKKGLVFGAQVVDSDYAGEIHISVINTSNVPVTITGGEKLIQFIHTPVLLSPLEEVDNDTFDKLHDASERGAGGFGSTGTK